MDDEHIAGLHRRGPGAGTVIGLALVTSVLASVATVFGLSRAALPAAPAPAAAAPSAAVATDGGVEEATRLPDLVRVPAANARSFLDALHLQLRVRGLRTDPNVPIECVVEQIPAPGARVRRGDTVEVVLSSGPAGTAPAPPAPADSGAPAQPSGAAAAVLPAPTADAGPGDFVTVPRVVGQRSYRARPLLEAAGLTLGRRTVIFDEDHGPHVVLRQSVHPGEHVARGTAVDLVVNQGE